MKYLVANTNVTVTLPDGSKQPKLGMEQWMTYHDHATVLHYPAISTRLICTAGRVSVTGSGSNETVEILKFSGSAEASTKYPVAAVLELRNLTPFFTKTFNPAGPVIQLIDGDSGTFSAGLECYGASLVRYSTMYNTLEYFPDFKMGVEGYGTGQTGGTTTWGTIFSFHEKSGAMAELEIQPPEMESRNEFEVYTIYSEYVTDEKGRHEKPDDWDTDEPKYLRDPQAEVPEKDGSRLNQRVYKIGFINPQGVFLTKHVSSTAMNFEPFIGMANYHPKYYFQVASMPESPEWAKSAYQGLDFNRLFEDETRYFDDLERK